MSLLAVISAARPATADAERVIAMPTPTVQPIPEADQVDLDVLVNPASTSVIRGATLTFPPGSTRATPVTDSKAWGYWGHAFWETWPIESWIAPTMDHMAAHGVNVIAFKGGATIVERGIITWDEYLARWVDTINYAKSLGMRCFVSYGDGGTYPGSPVVGWHTSTPTSTHARRIGEWAEALAGTGNVIGVDVLNEVWIWGGQAGSDAAGIDTTTDPLLSRKNHTDTSLAMYLDAVRAHGIPAAYDYQAGGQSNLGVTNWGPKVLERQDFLCFHRYADVTNTMVQDFRASHASTPRIDSMRVIFGEYGVNTANSTAVRQSRFSTMKGLISVDPTVAGTAAFAWTDFVDHMSPTDPEEANIPYWGMHAVNKDRTLTPRPDVLDIWKSWPTKR